MIRMRLLCCAGTLLAMTFCLFCNNAFAKVKVLDGDSLVVDGVEVRLEGIDAPEYKQKCYKESGKKYDCGERSKQELIKFINGRKVVCESKGYDKYHRMLGICFVEDKNINSYMVESGWAVEYDLYESMFPEEEKSAKENKRGMWQGRFMKPELYRRLYPRKHK